MTPSFPANHLFVGKQNQKKKRHVEAVNFMEKYEDVPLCALGMCTCPIRFKHDTATSIPQHSCVFWLTGSLYSSSSSSKARHPRPAKPVSICMVTLNYHSITHIPFHPVCIFAAKAAMLLVWSMMTLDDEDLVNTITYIKKVQAMIREYVAKTAPAKGWFSSDAPTAISLHYAVMDAESTLVTAVAQLLRDNMMQKLKGVLNIRGAWGAYKTILKDRDAFMESGVGELDGETVSGLNFGLGSFNLISSLLPPKIMSLASFLGYPCDRLTGLQECQKALDVGGVRSPLGSLNILMHHVFLQGSFCHNTLPYVDEAERVIRQSLDLFPNGGQIFHLFPLLLLLLLLFLLLSKISACFFSSLPPPPLFLSLPHFHPHVYNRHRHQHHHRPPPKKIQPKQASF